MPNPNSQLQDRKLIQWTMPVGGILVYASAMCLSKYVLFLNTVWIFAKAVFGFPFNFSSIMSTAVTKYQERSLTNPRV